MRDQDGGEIKVGTRPALDHAECMSRDSYQSRGSRATPLNIYVSHVSAGWNDNAMDRYLSVRKPTILDKRAAPYPPRTKLDEDKQRWAEYWISSRSCSTNSHLPQTLGTSFCRRKETILFYDNKASPKHPFGQLKPHHALQYLRALR